MAIAGLALLLQQLLVPLHLTWHEHDPLVSPGASAAPHAHHAHGPHVHHHGWSTHHHGPARATPPFDPTHEPHPAEDHLDPATVATIAPGLEGATGGPAAVPLDDVIQLGDGNPVAVCQGVERSPRPPPPARACAPRGPPSYV